MKLNFKIIIFFILLLLIVNHVFAKPKVGISMLKSAILPGWGELSNNNKTGYAFLTSELIFWITKYYYHNESELKEQASIYYAQKYAHIDTQKDFNSQFYLDLKKYSSSGFESGGYNANIVMKAKNLYPDNLEDQQNYINGNMYSDDFFWQWENKDCQYDYKILRKRIVQYSDYASVLTGFLILNRVVSVINSARISSKLKKLEMQVYLKNNMPFVTCKYNF